MPGTCTSTSVPTRTVHSATARHFEGVTFRSKENDRFADSHRTPHLRTRHMAAVNLPEPLLGPDGYHPVWDDLKAFETVGGPAYMYYDRDGQPITMRQWVTGMENWDYRMLARTMIERRNIEVVTVWTGLDEGGLSLDGEPPRIFGTIEVHHDAPTFSPEGARYPSYVNEETSCTEAEALGLHNRRVSELEPTDG